MDDRGRFHLPVRWSEQVGNAGEMVLTAGPDGSLLLLQRETFEQAAARIGDDLFCGVARRRLRSLFVGHAETVSVDKSNRVLIAETLRSYAGLDDAAAVYLVGSGSAIEIWQKQRWEVQAEAAKDDASLFDLEQGPGQSDGSPESDAVLTT